MSSSRVLFCWSCDHVAVSWDAAEDHLTSLLPDGGLEVAGLSQWPSCCMQAVELRQRETWPALSLIRGAVRTCSCAAWYKDYNQDDDGLMKCFINVLIIMKNRFDYHDVTDFWFVTGLVLTFW